MVYIISDTTDMEACKLYALSHIISYELTAVLLLHSQKVLREWKHILQLPYALTRDGMSLVSSATPWSLSN